MAGIRYDAAAVLYSRSLHALGASSWPSVLPQRTHASLPRINSSSVVTSTLVTAYRAPDSSTETRRTFFSVLLGTTGLHDTISSVIIPPIAHYCSCVHTECFSQTTSRQTTAALATLFPTLGDTALLEPSLSRRKYWLSRSRNCRRARNRRALTAVMLNPSTSAVPAVDSRSWRPGGGRSGQRRRSDRASGRRQHHAASLARRRRNGAFGPGRCRRPPFL